MTPEEYARDSWQTSGAAAPLPPLKDLRARADKFRRKIVRRNWIEYAAGLFVIVAFGIGAIAAPLLALRIGSSLIVGGTFVILWQLHKRGSPLTPPTHGGQMSVLDYRRRELARQRDALDSIFVWYLLPLIPGMLVVLAAPVLSLPMSEWQLPPLSAVPGLAMPVVIFAGIYALNKFTARRLQAQIDEIDALMAE